MLLNTETVLTTIAGHLAGVGLGQFDTTGHYLNHPDLPAFLFADADTPDVACVLTCTDQDSTLGHWTVEFSWRATGVTPRNVDALADAVFDHFRQVLGIRATGVVWSAGTAVEMPSLFLPGLLTWREAERLARGTAERTSDSKHAGNRWMRRDTYLMTMEPE